MQKCGWIILLWCWVGLLAVAAQSGAATRPASENIPPPDRQAIENTVRQLFNGMRAADSTAMKAVLAPTVRLLSVAANKEGQVVPRETSIRQFLRAVSQPQFQVLDERIWNIKVQQDGDFATLWCDYAFYLGDRFSHCGVDAFALYRSAGVWKIFSIIDTRRQAPCNLKSAAEIKNK
ncbi:MAG: hypothetical protein AVDCRST_MAG95-3628 [uncultured Adhaeribacter sp.]|uniref:Nuclear transport factor 2 family protein n=1 Tax=uncultured Adhaeribacter sp. TaxID=448109 RepID=A0A6J4JS11_9BACT|nr:MAG: hypothetical protein AVDCRST_MAG95-3628 [uncultured Adhaeribacter sp.]